MLIEFFNKHNKLLVLMVALAVIGIWSIIGDVVSIIIQIQHCNLFSSEATKSMISFVCYIFEQ